MYAIIVILIECPCVVETDNVSFVQGLTCLEATGTRLAYSA